MKPTKICSVHCRSVLLLVTCIVVSQASIPVTASAITRVQSPNTATKAQSDQVISPERLKVLYTRALASTVERELNQILAVPLRLTEPGVPYKTRQIAFHQTIDGVDETHAFAVKDTGDDGKILIMKRISDDTSLWVCDMQGKLLSAGRVENRKFYSRTVDEAKKSFDEEMRLLVDVKITPPNPRLP